VSAALGPEAGNGTERPQRSRTELEMEAGRQAAGRRAGRHRAHAASARAPIGQALPPEVLKLFAPVPNHLKGQAVTNEFRRGREPMTQVRPDACLAHPGTTTHTAGKAAPTDKVTSEVALPTVSEVTAASGVTVSSVTTEATKRGAEQPPKFIRPNFERMPPELKPLKNWVLWAAIWTGAKWTKRPVQVSGFGASTTNPKHWASFDDVKQAYERITAAGGYLELREKGKTQKVLIGGVGFVFDGQLDQDRLVFAGVDFDGVMSQQTITSFAKEHVKRLGSYTEASVSGRGLHVILKARPLSSGVAHCGVELYTSGRFFTMTGQAGKAGGTPIIAAPDAFAALADELAQSKGTAGKNTGGETREETADAKNNAWFDRLPAEKQSEVVRYAVAHIANNSKLFELRERGGSGYQVYLALTVSIARSGVADAEDIFVEAASTAKGADPEEELREFFRSCAHAKEPLTEKISVGTLIYHAKQCGANFDQWKREVVSVPWLPTGSFAEVNPVAALMALRDQGADIQSVLLAMNQTFAVVKYGSEIMVATIIGKKVDFMKLAHFHNMLANLVVWEEIEVKDDSGNPKKTTRSIIVSKRWLKWNYRRQYLCRGVVFEPGGPLEIPTDMLNLWRGFGIEPKQGDWSVMLNHIRDVICSGNKDHFQYLIRWMAYGVQHPDRPIGVAIALRGEEGAGKGFVWRNYGKLFGNHFKHVAHGEHLTGRFNAALAEACTVFLDEALWAGDRKGEQILKALVTEDTFQLERKFCDPIPVKNRLRIVIASNNQWIVPVSTRGRRYCVLDVSDLYADENDPAHAAYWEPLQAQFGDYAPDQGRAAMLYDLLHMDLSNFNIRAVPKSAAKTEQKLLTQTGTEAWLFEILQDGAVTKSTQGIRHTISEWDGNGMQISRDDAYDAFLQSSQERREYKPRSKEWWSRDLRKILKESVSDERPRKNNPNRNRFLIFRSLNECRKAYSEFVHADDIDWEPADEPNVDTVSSNSNGGAHIDGGREETDAAPDIEWEPDGTDAEADIDWEPVDEPDTDIEREHEAEAGLVQVMPGPQ
jgi:Family of unknown function (DUF5906)